MGLTTVTTSDPLVEIGDVQEHLRIADSDHNDTLVGLVLAATDYIERETGQALRPTTLLATFDCFPAADISLPRPPLASVQSVKYIDAAGVLQTVPTATYTVDTASKPGRLALNPGQTWPTSYGPNSVSIAYTAGYANEAALPATLKQLCLLMIGHWFENREGAIDRRIDTVPLAVESLVAMHTFHELAG